MASINAGPVFREKHCLHQISVWSSAIQGSDQVRLSINPVGLRSIAVIVSRESILDEYPSGDGSNAGLDEEQGRGYLGGFQRGNKL